MQLENIKLVRHGDIPVSEQLINLVKEQVKKIKLTVPFKADGFKSTNHPTQPDGTTPLVVESANIGGAKLEEVNKVKVEPSKDEIKEDKSKNKKVYSENEIYAMSKSEQVKLLKKLNADKIPSIEKERVKLILKLQ